MSESLLAKEVDDQMAPRSKADFPSSTYANTEEKSLSPERELYQSSMSVMLCLQSAAADQLGDCVWCQCKQYSVSLQRNTVRCTVKATRC